MSKVPAAAMHTIATPTHGRFLVREASASPAAGVLIGFHGYGHRAETLLADLDAIPGAGKWLTVSVQGLHRFYTKSGQIVASWLTSEDRELAIADNVTYARAVADIVRPRQAEGQPPSPSLPLVLAGFSQGAAMAFRAAAHIPGCAGVMALGGDIPPELRQASVPLPPVLLGRGLGDQWYSHEKFSVDAAWLAAMGIDATICEFEGGHVWTDTFRAAAGQFLARMAALPHGPPC